LRTEVAHEMRRGLDANFNPSSLHAEGRQAAAALDAARERVADSLGAARNEIIFTGSGTESDNLAIFGVLRAAGKGAHFLTTAFEHHAVLAPLDRLRTEGFEVTVLPVGRDGLLDVQAFAEAMRPRTVLASVMYANNEIGTVQPLAALSGIAHGRGALFHTDAIASPCWLPLGVGELGVDLLSLSAHKCGGPKGVGALYVRRGVAMAPITYGGSQEFGRRPGTQNLTGIAGMAAAMALAVSERKAQTPRVSVLRERLENGIQATIPEVRINGGEPRLPNVLNVSFAAVESSPLLIALDLAGVAVSAGSACTSGSPEPSHVVAALGLEPAWQRGAIRFSLGISTTQSEIDRVLELLPPIVADLRRPNRSRPASTAAARGDG
jgi:cysteine desulfurase